MDPFRKRMLKELEQMQQHHTGRILRGMSLLRRMPLESDGWQPATDMYEADDHILVYVDLAGVVGDTLRVTVDGRQLHISGYRELPAHHAIACIHQLEIELGAFQRTVLLPAAIDVEGVESAYSNGILMVSLPRKSLQGRVSIRIVSGE